MKRTLIKASLGILLTGLLVHTSQKLGIQEMERLRLRKEYQHFAEMKKLFNGPKNSVQSQNVLSALEDVIHRVNLKEKVSQIRPEGHEIEIVFQDLTQEEMLQFLESLNSLQGARITRADLSETSSDALIFSVTLALI